MLAMLWTLQSSDNGTDNHRFSANPMNPTQFLSDLRILDFSPLFPGPYATHLLSDLGADVLRVESPARDDLLLHLPPLVDGQSAAHRSINRNKGSVTINLKDPAGAEQVHALLAERDILVESFRPGVMQRLGLDYASLKQRFPRLIYLSLTGYGQDGPLAQRAGHDINYLALSGLASYSGRRETGPVLSAAQLADCVGAHHAALAILAAVNARRSSGQGCHLDIAIADCAFATNAMFGANALASGTAPQLGAEPLNGGHVYDYYATADGRYLSFGGLEPKFVIAFFDAIGKPDWLPPVASSDPAVIAELKTELAGLIESAPLSQWREIFEAIDACVEPVLDLTEASQHPHFRARGMIRSTTTEAGTPLEQIDQPIRVCSQPD